MTCLTGITTRKCKKCGGKVYNEWTMDHCENCGHVEIVYEEPRRYKLINRKVLVKLKDDNR